MYNEKIKALLYGVAVGDALGVPVEFKSRMAVRHDPVTDMRGYGTYNLPSGTWSDDSSLTFCLAEALTEDFSLERTAQYFVDWCYDNFWTPRGRVFDIGISTRIAIERLRDGVSPEMSGGIDIRSNGNGSLMRISPLVFHIMDKPAEQRLRITKDVSSITHGHWISVLSCFYFLEFARLILEQQDKMYAYLSLQEEFPALLESMAPVHTNIQMFDRLLKGRIDELPEQEISSSGFVLHTLEACIWCILTTDNFKDAVLKAVNLGDDTDTTGAVTGALAGLLYGYDNIPATWIDVLAKKEEIGNLAERLGKKILG